MADEMRGPLAAIHIGRLPTLPLASLLELLLDWDDRLVATVKPGRLPAPTGIDSTA